MGIKDKIKKMLDKDSRLLKFVLGLYNYFPFNNLFRGKGIVAKFAHLRKCKISIRGKNCSVVIGKGVQLEKCRISVSGNHNQIIIGDYVSGCGLDICVEDDKNYIYIGRQSTFSNNVHLACIEGCRLEIGEDCMFSANISVRVGDSHSVVDMEGRRINPSKSVKIGNHVWIGNTVLITKGVEILDDSVIGTGSVVTRKFEEKNVAIGGNPAKIIKRNISWDRDRLTLGEEYK